MNVLAIKPDYCHQEAEGGGTVHPILMLVSIIAVKGWEATFLIRAFGLSGELSTEVGFAFLYNGLKSQDLRLRMKNNHMIFLIMSHDFRFCLGIVTTHLTYQCPKCLFHMEKLNN